MRFPLQGAVVLETSYIPGGDRFAAQIDYATGRCPSICRLVDLGCSFRFCLRRRDGVESHIPRRFQFLEMVVRCQDRQIVGAGGSCDDGIRKF